MDEAIPGAQERSSNWEKFKIPVLFLILGIFVFIVGMRLSTFSEEPKVKFIDSQTSTLPFEVSLETITIDVSGAVLHPGVYTLPASKRIKDAIDTAGGISNDADSDWVAKHVNLAAKVKDGVKIYIPKKGETSATLGTSNNNAVSIAGPESGKININTASESELDSLPGVGDVTAKKIIAGRPYSDTQELLSKKIVGPAVFEKIKEQIITN